MKPSFIFGTLIMIAMTLFSMISGGGGGAVSSNSANPERISAYTNLLVMTEVCELVPSEKDVITQSMAELRPQMSTTEINTARVAAQNQIVGLSSSADRKRACDEGFSAL